MSELPQNGGGAASAALAPPPLISLDQPNPPNVVISQSSGLPQSLPPTGCVSSDPSGFMLSTRQIITASRLCPDLEVTSCANDPPEDVDLDKMYMEAMMEDLKYSVGR